MRLDMEEIWVFGYGSLCWRPGFKYDEVVKGHIKGFVRRFYQGNTVHRGSPQKPGRVATLVPDRKGLTHGCAYRIPRKESEEILDYLEERENRLGGYSPTISLFYPESGSDPLASLTYIALPGNTYWLGEDDESTMAQEIGTAFGNCGSNVEYLAFLRSYMRKEFPQVRDPHLEALYSYLTRR